MKKAILMLCALLTMLMLSGCHVIHNIGKKNVDEAEMYKLVDLQRQMLAQYGDKLLDLLSHAMLPDPKVPMKKWAKMNGSVTDNSNLEQYLNKEDYAELVTIFEGMKIFSCSVLSNKSIIYFHSVYPEYRCIDTFTLICEYNKETFSYKVDPDDFHLVYLDESSTEEYRWFFEYMEVGQ